MNLGVGGVLNPSQPTNLSIIIHGSYPGTTNETANTDTEQININCLTGIQIPVWEQLSTDHSKLLTDRYSLPIVEYLS